MVVYSGPAVMGITELLVDLFADGDPFSMQNPVAWGTTQVGILLLQASGPVVFLVLASMVTLSGVGIARLGRMILMPQKRPISADGWIHQEPTTPAAEASGKLTIIAAVALAVICAVLWRLAH